MKNIIIIFTVLILTACSSSPPVTPLTYKEPLYNVDDAKQTGNTSMKNYQIDEIKFVTVGSTMFEVIEYNSIKNNNTYALLSLQGLTRSEIGKGRRNYRNQLIKINGEKYTIVGPNKQNLDGTYSSFGQSYYFVVNLKTGMIDIPFKFYSMQDHDMGEGSFKESSAHLYLDRAWEIKNPVPLDFTKPVFKVLRINPPIKIKYKLIYKGIDSNSFKISYREYTSNNIARPAFYIDLTYDKSQNIITFRDFKIKVIKVNNEGIKFQVIKDNLPPDLSDTLKKIIN